MDYNNGFSHNDFYGHSLSELKERAKAYSEGNEDFEQALLNMWAKDIRTMGCCIGHPKGDPKYTDGRGYLAFYLDNDNSHCFLSILRKLDIFEDDVMVDVTYSDLITNLLQLLALMLKIVERFLKLF